MRITSGSSLKNSATISGANINAMAEAAVITAELTISVNLYAALTREYFLAP